MKAVVRRAAAARDIEAAVEYYIEVAGPDVAARFEIDLDVALNHVAAYPGTGSRRYAGAGARRDLRFWLMTGFPYALFYRERHGQIELLRVLHQSRNIPAHLAH